MSVPDFNSGRVPQPGGAAVIRTPEGVADIAVAGDIETIQEVAVEEAAAAEPKKRPARRKVDEETPDA